ncbi:MAG TPA: PVC-type heme-binding CxxCH protein, partial [Planctomycetota bacterium]|nr:PVC-type heme-binding CxxCH protein [Planctomycetota bacterium]
MLRSFLTRFPRFVSLPAAALAAVLLFLPAATRAQGEPSPLRALFLGDGGHHRPAERFRQLQPVLEARGIQLEYTDKVGDLNPDRLAPYDCLVIYANITRISPPEEAALLAYVAGGKGLVPLHCASYCFLSSPAYIDLVGAQFQRHGTGVFRTTLARGDHPILKGYRGFESWDETYVHHRHNEKDRTVLEYRVEGTEREPWTWIRTHGKGRVFYTAWGHDGRTWGHPGFQNLVERGIRWASGADPLVVPPYSDGPEMTPRRTGLKPFEYVEAKVPFYPSGKPWGTIGEPIATQQVPLAPEESIQHMVTPVGFEVKLFASEPEIVKPIGMSWDERGRLWITETVDYPNDLQPEGQGNDRIQVCEDTDGDGKADKFTVFADKLSLPTSLTFSRGGVIVHQPPQTLFLRDVDGDDIADERKVLFTGWSTADTHAGPSNLHYGFDNWIWGIVGYSGFRGEVGGERVSFQTGFYRFKPDGSRLEFLRNTNNNSWGVGFNEEGVCFGSTANGNPSVYLPIPNRYYEAVRGMSSSVLRGIAGSPRMYPITDKVRQVDFHGAFTSAAGHAVYTARTYPREYWNRAAFVSEPTGHLISTFLIERSGADFRSRNAWNLLASDDEWCAPIVAEVGPDGHVWVIDWYNYIVQHNPTPAGFRTGKGNAYVTDLRDKKHGRILRLVYTGGTASKPASLRDASPQDLVAALRNDNLLWRKHAQRLLVERGQKDVVPALIELVGDKKVDEIGLNTGVIHSLWTLEGLGALDGSDPAAAAAAVQALRHESAAVRRNALLVLPRGLASVEALLAAGGLGDRDGQVRLAALLVLSEMPRSPAAAEAIAAALGEASNLDDRWLVDGLTFAAAANDVDFLKAMASRAPAGDPNRGVLGIVERVAEHYARGTPSESLGALLASLAEGPAGASFAVPVIAGLARGWPRDARLTAGALNEDLLGRLLKGLPPAAQGHLVSLAGRWESEVLKSYATEIAAKFLSVVEDEGAAEPRRIEAARQLLEFGRTDAGAAKKVLGLITGRTAPDFAKGLLEALSLSEAPEAGEAIVESIQSMTPGARALAVKALLGRREWTRALLGAIEQGEITVDEIPLDQRQALASHPDRRMAREARRLFERGGTLPSPDRQAVLAELLPLAEEKGDAGQGKLLFQKQCAKCHTHGGEGTKVGPDLTGMSVHPRAELLTQIIDPSRSLEGTYRVYTAVTTDGRVLNGLLASESKTSIELVDADAKRHSILREDLDQLTGSSKSLMPEGFEKQLSRDDLVNLLEFLAQRGKYLPLSLSKVATAVSTRGMFTNEDASVERLIFSDWSPKTFEGVPFQLVDPQGDRVPNVILLHGPQGNLPPKMPKSVRLSCNSPAKAIHLLGGVSGWGFPYSQRGSTSMIVRLHYENGTTEDHPLKNGEHLADYIRRVDVPGSKLAFRSGNQQIRCLAVFPKESAIIREVELVK